MLPSREPNFYAGLQVAAPPPVPEAVDIFDTGACKWTRGVRLLEKFPDAIDRSLVLLDLILVGFSFIGGTEGAPRQIVIPHEATA